MSYFVIKCFVFTKIIRRHHYPTVPNCGEGCPEIWKPPGYSVSTKDEESEDESEKKKPAKAKSKSKVFIFCYILQFFIHKIKICIFIL